jgi:hypothetical protein
VNASFFTFTASAPYPGTPVGLGLHQGTLLSAPTTDPAETDLLIDARSNRLTIGRLHWTGTLRGPRTTLAITTVNEPPLVPFGCTDLPDPTTCTTPGQVARITRPFAASTPTGPGAEITLDRRGCITHRTRTRGTTLRTGETAIQATGNQTGTLLALTGCPRQSSTLTDDNGRTITPRPGLYGVNGRYRLIAGNTIVVPAGTGSFFDRNPRTIAGTTRTGKIVLATIDGRMTTSVGTTLNETAALAKALGLTEALNLDGGGSTTMSVRGTLTNTPSGTTQRPVGDALIWTE